MASKTSAWAIGDVAVQSHGEETKAVPNPKPRWWLLYAMIPVAIVLLLAARGAVPSAGWRQLADCAVSVAVLGGMAVWLRMNRVALNLREAKVTEPDIARW